MELEAELDESARASRQPLRRRLPDTRMPLTHKFDIAGHEGYLTVGLFEDGQPGELFITMAKEGTTIGGLMDTIGTLTSMALQYGVPLEASSRSSPTSVSSRAASPRIPDIRNASSITDYVFRWMAASSCPATRKRHRLTADRPSWGSRKFRRWKRKP